MAGINFKAFFEKVNPVTNHTVRTILVAAATAIATSLGMNPLLVNAAAAMLNGAPAPAVQVSTPQVTVKVAQPQPTSQE